MMIDEDDSDDEDEGDDDVNGPCPTNSFSLGSLLPPPSLAARSSWLDARLSPPFSPGAILKSSKIMR